jgi:hypothetical protein
LGESASVHTSFKIPLSRWNFPPLFGRKGGGANLSIYDDLFAWVCRRRSIFGDQYTTPLSMGPYSIMLLLPASCVTIIFSAYSGDLPITTIKISRISTFLSCRFGSQYRSRIRKI